MWGKRALQCFQEEVQRPRPRLPKTQPLPSFLLSCSDTPQANTDRDRTPEMKLRWFRAKVTGLKTGFYHSFILRYQGGLFTALPAHCISSDLGLWIPLKLPDPSEPRYSTFQTQVRHSPVQSGLSPKGSQYRGSAMIPTVARPKGLNTIYLRRWSLHLRIISRLQKPLERVL